MSKIECSNCNEIVEFTGSTLTLPFVCGSCEAAAEFQEKIAPKPVAFDQPVAGDDHFPLDENDATVENTTLLIADLEEQNAQLTRAQEDANALIEDMSKQLEEDVAIIGDRDREIVELTHQNSELIYAKDAAWAHVNGLAQREFEAREQNRLLILQNDDLKSKLDSLFEKIYRFRDKVYEIADEKDAEINLLKFENTLIAQETYRTSIRNFNLRNRGFWARVFNRG